jgi:hypothetical protein
MDIIFLALTAVFPLVFLIATHHDSVLPLSIITWGIGLIGLFLDVEGYGWILVIFWMLFGIPIAILYCVVLLAFVAFLRNAFSRI